MVRQRQNSAKRKQAERKGRRAEWVAVVFLTLSGYSVVARRFKVKSGEIDIIAKRGSLIAFIEVKARSSLEEAITAVTPRNRRRIEAAGRSFISRYPRFSECALRYDICAAAPWRFRWWKNAWREGD